MDERINTTASKRCVDCLVVKKVYDACSKRECLEKLPFVLQLPCGTLDDYTYLYTQFGKAEVEPYEGEPFFTEKDDCYAKLRMVVAVPVWVVLRRRSDRAIFRVAAYPVCGGSVQSDNYVRLPLDMTVYAPKEFLRQGRFEPYAESFVECGCALAVDHNTMQLSLGFFLIIKVLSDVQLKVPNFGFCEIPPECDDEPCDLNFCQSFLDGDVTPFPQFFPNDIG